jgi:hypothetical protein
VTICWKVQVQVATSERLVTVLSRIQNQATLYVVTLNTA